MEKITWHNEKRKVADLIPADYNPRVLTDKARKDLVASIEEFSEVEPVVVNTNGNIIGGHQRSKIYADLGIEEIDVRVPSRQLTTEEEIRLNIRLNKNVAEWDPEKLKELNVDMLLDTGFEKMELTGMWGDLGITKKEFDEEKEVERAKKDTQVKTGEVYQLGQHRLMCGDSTNADDVAKLMGGVKADMIYCDPPYNIGLDYTKGIGQKSNYGGSYSSKKDSKTDEAYMAFVGATIEHALNNSKEDVHVFYWCDERFIWTFQVLYKELGVDNKRVCLWIKERANPVPGVAFNKVYEPCVYGTRGRPFMNPHVRDITEVMNKEINGGNQAFDDMLAIIDLWIVKRDGTDSYAHPTQKPITLHEKPLKRCSAPGGVVIDLFGGSGSTLMACEQMKRKAYLMEQDPVFAQVIINRYQDETGDKAIRL